MRMLRSPLPLLLLLTTILVSVPRGTAPTRLEGTIVGDETGKPVAARICAIDDCGRTVEIQGEHSHVEYLGKRWCYVDGSFSLELPSSGVKLEIRRGFETRPLFAVVEPSNDGRVARVFRLRRWTNMREQRLTSGDIHAHVPLPAEAHRQMRAEDLNVPPRGAWSSGRTSRTFPAPSLRLGWPSVWWTASS